MMNDKRGLSTIIVTLIMILLVIVAAGIIWVVIQNVVGESTGQINIGTDCLNVGVSATKVTNSSPTVYGVTLTRSAGGSTIGGVKLVLTNATGTSSYIHDRSGNIGPLATVTENVVTTGATEIVNANRVDVIVYFLDRSGKKQVCSISNSYTFQL